ncbi:hypothetical protein F5876DRAFT_70661 [Lentinula aff. lateritia]|uniref:Uncharacterized protein n=1 Tax=Lentinula aff. lateritia TaxID=2804960 RepID=A0ACC1TIH9_9AGAR|nr:hypothetical protein F5876DRAFT_70661 [Lentinula aff. lateritia]
MNNNTTAVIVKTKPPPTPVKIDFIISLQKLDQLDKLATKRKPFGVRSFDLERTDDWDALKLKLIKITKKSFPHKLIDLEQYGISYPIPRKSSDPVPLLNEQDFPTILSLTKSSKSPLVNIYPQKENGNSSSDSDSSSSSSEDRTSKRKANHSKKKKKKKEDKTKENPMNMALTAKVKLLQETHKCSDNDGSDYCFWTEADQEHKPLSKTMLHSWGEALMSHLYLFIALSQQKLQLKEDDDIATITKPPNNQHFDRFNTEKGRISPLLEKRLNSAHHSSAVPTIINQIHMPAEFIPQRPATVNSSAPLLAPAVIAPSKLVPTHLGPDMTVDNFCQKYELGGTISVHLVEQGYMKTKTFQHITLDDLKEMMFKLGEIASLCVAVAEWASQV